MALLYCSRWSAPDLWRDAFRALDPSIDFRVWPESGPAKEIDYALAWHHEPGSLLAYPRLKAIFSLGAGVEKLLRDKKLPSARGRPCVRSARPPATSCRAAASPRLRPGRRWP